MSVLAEIEHYGTPDYEDDKPEPKRKHNEVIFDREGVGWRRFGDGWIVAGDSRVQLWRDVQKWFDLNRLDKLSHAVPDIRL